MADIRQIKHVIAKNQARIEQDVALLRVLLQNLSVTKGVIERGVLAYESSVRTLRMVEGLTENSRLTELNPLPPRASPLT